MDHVYLLSSVANPKRYYIGFTTKPQRRLRQHNGEIKGGAKRTRMHRPWQLVCVVSGFHSRQEALQFEYLWGHSNKSIYARSVLLGKRGLGTCLTRKINELAHLLFPHLSVTWVHK